MGKTILLVDDTPLFLRMGSDALVGSPVRVITARDGEEALALARKELPDIAVLDLHMPKMDGARCCLEMKADPALARMPVIIVTKTEYPDDIRRCHEAGCDLLLSKPLSPPALLGALHAYLPEIDRRPRRVPFAGKVILETDTGIFSGVGVDLSEKGLGAVLEGVLPREVGIRKVVFYLGEGGDPTEGSGSVIWARPKGGNKTAVGLQIEVTGPGLSFMRLHEVRSFIAAAVTKGERR